MGCKRFQWQTANWDVLHIFHQKRTPSLTSHTCSENNAVFLNPFFMKNNIFALNKSSSMLFFLFICGNFLFLSVEIFCSHLKIRFTSIIHKNMFNRPKTRIRCNFEFFFCFLFQRKLDFFSWIYQQYTICKRTGAKFSIIRNSKGTLPTVKYKIK